MAMRELSRVTRDENDEEEDVWVSHYSSNHLILLVGEGDFSFSCSLATSFASASNIYASSLDSYGDVIRKYKKARSNLETLRRLGAVLLHGVDATKLHLYYDLRNTRFDRIIFNFPHAGFHGKEKDPSLIRKHKELVFGFFRVASHMLRDEGQIHVSHKNKAPYCHWNLEKLASKCCLVLMQCVAFEKSKYPGYENKRGDGTGCDQPFVLGECSTFKFRFCRVAKELYAEKMKGREEKERESKCPEDLSNKQPVSFEFQGVSQRPVSFDLSYLPDQSRERTSNAVGLGYYYGDQKGSQFVGASYRETERPVPLFLERNHSRFQDGSIPLISTERSSFGFQDSTLQASHHRQEQLLECSSRVNRVSHELYSGERHWTRLPHPYTGESSLERGHLLQRDFPFQARPEQLLERYNGVSNGIYNGEVRSQLTLTSFPHPYR